MSLAGLLEETTTTELTEEPNPICETWHQEHVEEVLGIEIQRYNMDMCSIIAVARVHNCIGEKLACQSWVDYWNTHAEARDQCANCRRPLFDCWSVTPL